MRKIKLYSAASLNGKIAKKDGSVTWLDEIPNPEQIDYGYASFLNSIDTTIQGYNTYKQLIDWGIEFPYANKKNYVLTQKQGLNNTEYVEFINSNPIDFIRELKKQKGADIWLIGGGQINTLLLNANLIDEIWVYVMPILLTEGINLFENLPQETKLKLISSSSFAGGVVELKYKID